MISVDVSNGPVTIGDNVAYASKYFGVRPCEVVKISAVKEYYSGNIRSFMVVKPIDQIKYSADRICLTRLDHVLKLG